MSLFVIQERFDKLLAAVSGKIILLKGPWGVGKTYQWEAALKRYFGGEKKKPLKYAYVSLFGLSSIADLRRRIVEETVTSIELSNDGGRVGDAISEISPKLKLGQILKLLPVLPYLSKLDSLANDLSFAMVKDTVICLDDLERASPTLKLGDVLGLASFLKEQRNCRIAILTNDEKIDPADRPNLDKYLEKVVDEVVELLPTPEEACEIAIGSTRTRFAALLADCLLKLEVVNIRVISRLHRLASELEAVLVGYHEQVTLDAIHTLTLFGVAHFLPSNKIPPIEYLETYGSDTWVHFSIQLNKNEPESPHAKEQAKWDEIIRAYGYGTTSEFDLEISKSIKQGYANKSRLITIASELSKNADGRSRHSRLDRAWDVLFDSLDDNKKGAVTSLMEAVDIAADTFSLSEMHRVFEILHDLGESESAQRALSRFIAVNQERVDVFDIDSVAFPDDIRSASFRDQVAAEYQRHQRPDILHVALDRIDTNSGSWRGSDVARVAEATEEELYALLKSSNGNELRKRLRTLTSLGRTTGDVDYPRIQSKTIAVLRRLASESAINQVRLSSFLPRE